MKEQIYKVANRLPAVNSGAYLKIRDYSRENGELSFLVATEEESLRSFDKLKIKTKNSR